MASDVISAPCVIEESNVDWDNLKQCIGNYPEKFLTKIDKMSKAHKEIKRGTEFFVEGVQSMLKDLSIKLTTKLTQLNVAEGEMRKHTLTTVKAKFNTAASDCAHENLNRTMSLMEEIQRKLETDITGRTGIMSSEVSMIKK